MTLLVIAYFMLLYSQFVVSGFGVYSLYMNPFVRGAEFLIGVSFAQLLFGENTQDISKWKGNTRVAAITLLGILGISVGFATILNFDKRTYVFDCLVIPVVLFLFWLSSFMKCPFLEKNRLLSMLSGMSYQFFLMQLYLWLISAFIIEKLHLAGTHSEKIIISFCVCFAGAFVIYQFVDKPIRAYLIRKLLS